MRLPFLSLVALVGVFAGCTAKQNSEQEAIFTVIRQHFEATQREDADGVMATLHSGMLGYEGQKANYEEVFKQYDLKFELSNMKLESLINGEAKVAFTQKTLPTGGKVKAPDLISDSVMTLKKDGDKWKIVNSVQYRTQALPAK